MLETTQRSYRCPQVTSDQNVSSSNLSARLITLGLWSATKSSVVLSAPAVARRSVTIRLEASLAASQRKDAVSKCSLNVFDPYVNKMIAASRTYQASSQADSAGYETALS